VELTPEIQFEMTPDLRIPTEQPESCFPNSITEIVAGREFTVVSEHPLLAINSMDADQLNMAFEFLNYVPDRPIRLELKRLENAEPPYQEGLDGNNILFSKKLFPDSPTGEIFMAPRFDNGVTVYQTYITDQFLAEAYERSFARDGENGPAIIISNDFISYVAAANELRGMNSDNISGGRIRSMFESLYSAGYQTLNPNFRLTYHH
jgi:hypothetical protein